MSPVPLALIISYAVLILALVQLVQLVSSRDIQRGQSRVNHAGADAQVALGNALVELGSTLNETVSVVGEQQSRLGALETRCLRLEKQLAQVPTKVGQARTTAVKIPVRLGAKS